MKVGDGTPSLVIPRPVRKLVVGIRLFAVQSTAPPMAAGGTDCHAAYPLHKGAFGVRIATVAIRSLAMTYVQLSTKKHPPVIREVIK